MAELKPCPFCGCTYYKDHDDYYFAGDHEEWCPLNRDYQHFLVPNEPKDIDAWNRRVGDD